MILTVTFNPAWDVTHDVERLELGTTHRVRSVAVRAGGKGLNVSRVLHQHGHATTVTGLIAGPSGQDLRQALAAEGIEENFFLCSAPDVVTRRTFTVVESTGVATVMTEPGPAAGTVDWQELRLHVERLIDKCALVVLSGSLPPAVPVVAYAELVAYARSRRVPVIVDADGVPLALAVAAGPDLVKPNLDDSPRQPAPAIQQTARDCSWLQALGGWSCRPVQTGSMPWTPPRPGTPNRLGSTQSTRPAPVTPR